MPVLKNIKHEAFAQAVAKGKSAAAAYKAAGYKPSRKNASRLRTNEDISARVAELQSRVAAQVVKSRAQVLSDLARNADAAYDGKQFSASNQALKLYGQEAHQMFVNRHIVGTKPIEEMTEPELEALLGISKDEAADA